MISKTFFLTCLLISIASCTQNKPEPQVAANRVASKQSERSVSDRALDAGRRPEQLLKFAQVKEGMQVVDMMAGKGYTTEILARAVGPAGKVYAQNNAFVLERFAEQPLRERLEKDVMQNVVRLDQELDLPLPLSPNSIDAVLMVLFYHDSVWMNVNRRAMNQAIFDALKPGGLYVLLDHAAAQGRGLDDVKALHRIEAEVVRAEVEAAGFVLDATSDVWAESSDDHSWNASPKAAGDKRGHSDRFALRFKKPQ